MRKEYLKSLRKQFGDFVGRLEPPFKSFKCDSEYHFPNNYDYKVEVGKDVVLFLGIIVDPKGVECFTIWFGWSTLGRFPELDESEIMEKTPDESDFASREFRDRVGAFLGEDKWWFLEEAGNWNLHFAKMAISEAEADARVSEALAEVKVVIGNQVMPYLKAFLESTDRQTR